MADTEIKLPKTRDEINKEQLTQIVEKAQLKNKLSSDGQDVTDPALQHFIPLKGLDKESFVNTVLNFFNEIDPTTNKEYIRWFIKLYSEFLKKRIPLNDVNNIKWLKLGLATSASEIVNSDLPGGKNYLFFEDFYKLTDYIELYERLKTMRLEICKDILEYNDYRDFIDVVQPFKLMLYEKDENKNTTKQPAVIKLDFDSAELEALNKM
jgi:hypothetical protein